LLGVVAAMQQVRAIERPQQGTPAWTPAALSTFLVVSGQARQCRAAVAKLQRHGRGVQL
jgi:hypothetical protein